MSKESDALGGTVFSFKMENWVADEKFTDILNVLDLALIRKVIQSTTGEIFSQYMATDTSREAVMLR